MTQCPPSSAGTAFAQRARDIEEELFSGLLDPKDITRMKNVGQYSWLYRPSHHIKTGLVTETDILMLQKPHSRMLSVGAATLALEQTLEKLGVPAEHIVAADKNPMMMTSDGGMKKIVFDMTQQWPDTAMFDLIIFPESLCIALTNAVEESDEKTCEDYRFPHDEKQSRVLAHILGEALKRLRPRGEIRANGPMSHPNIVSAASHLLKSQGMMHSIIYERFFLVVRKK